MEICQNITAEPFEQPAAQVPDTESLMLVSAENKEQKSVALADSIGAFLLTQPQVECPVVHHFGPGIYIREVHLKAGTLAVGHAQKYEHLNILLKGVVAMIVDGEVRELHAPMIFTGQPGSKFGYIVEDTVWQNVYATEERDINKLEEMFVEKNPAWVAKYSADMLAETIKRAEDRDDFAEVIRLAGYSPEQVRKESETEDDQIPMPSGYNVTVRESAIEGLGLFSSVPVCSGSVIAPARIGDKRTPAGRYTNHSKNPNAEFVRNDIGDIWLVAKRDIQGCMGGSYGEEITVDYAQTLALHGINIERLE